MYTIFFIKLNKIIMYKCYISKMPKKNKSSTIVNKRTVDSIINSAMSNELPAGVYFGKVLGKLGENRMRIYYEESSKGYEGIGKIRGALQGKGRCPIQTNDIVTITIREFESSHTSKKHFDIICVFDSKQSYELKKEKIIPDYFLNPMDCESFHKKEAGEIEFDYGDSDSVDIETI